MGSTKSKVAPPRPISPKPPLSSNDSHGHTPRDVQDTKEARPSQDLGLASRGRERENGELNGLRQLRASEAYSASPSPTRISRPGSTPQNDPPSVNVLPPQSPPKPRVSNLVVGSAPAMLSSDAPQSASGTSSPRHFRIPSRPHTPLIDSARSPRLHPSRPPSPPPPRRSVEMRREPSMSFKAPPPPVNRAEKPKIASKPTTLSVTEVTTLMPATPRNVEERTSPFNTPPNGLSPEHELPPALPGPRPRQSLDATNIPGHRTFEPPPVHHSVVSRRRDHETNGSARGFITPQVTGDDRSNLPSRQNSVLEPPKPRVASGILMPPPPRPSMDKPRALPPSTAPTVDTSYATPPKRVVSTPTTHSPTPPRTHGRSMTVDRTSHRTPAEFRAPPVSSTSRVEPRASLDLVPASTVVESAHPNLGDYPDSSHSNRRPPVFKQGVKDISAKYDTRVMDICGEYVCTTGLMTRVWNVLDGDVVMSIVHGEGVKMMSMAFKPAGDVSDEGKRLWLGNNIGELMEVDIPSQSVVSTKSNAHTRREIIKIYRHLNEMWTLDDGGTLHLWAPDASGAPTLSNPYQSFRVPKGHTFSMVVVDELWHATGKDLRVFAPTMDGSAQFQILARPLNQPNTGDITSGAVIKSQLDKVYISHADGKVSIYSRRDYSCLGVVNISMYKITSLTAVNQFLWAGFSTGTIYVYDTSVSPWVVKKDWRAYHDIPVIKLSADPSSFWTFERDQVVSLGQDNVLRIWDGLMQDDWMENRMVAEQQDFSDLENIRALVMTWNAGASTPYHLQHSAGDENFFRDLLGSSDCPDILVFGFQELVDLEDKKTTASKLFVFVIEDIADNTQRVSSNPQRKRTILSSSI